MWIHTQTTKCDAYEHVNEKSLHMAIYKMDGKSFES